MRANESDEKRNTDTVNTLPQNESEGISLFRNLYMNLGFDFVRYQLSQLHGYLLIFFVLIMINLFHRRLGGGSTLSLVVKVYLFVFAFLLIYNVTIAAPAEIVKKYQGRVARIIYIFESKLLPILTLYFMIALYTLSDFAGEPGWPLFSFIRALDGQHTNLIVYSLLLMYALKAKINPLITIPVFFAVSLVYYRINLFFYSEYFAGFPVLFYKGLKLTLIFFLSIWDLSMLLRSAVKRFLFALSASAFTIGSVFGLLMLIYLVAAPSTPIWMESAKKLARFGYHVPLRRIARIAADRKDVRMVKDIYNLMVYYDQGLEYTTEKWNGMLYQPRLQDAELAASYMLKEGVLGNPYEIADYIEKKSAEMANVTLNSLATLCAKSCTTDESVLFLLSRLKNGLKKPYMLWLIRVLSETGSCLPVIPLTEYLYSLDDDIAKSTYESLKSLTGKAPAETGDGVYNGVESIRAFKAFYLENCTAE